jgi:DinB superfamily
MRPIVLVATLLFCLARTASAGELTPGERQRLLAHLEMTEQWLVSELAGLSPAQLTFRMAPDSWSIMDVVEHLAIAEPQYWQKLRDSMKQPPTTEKLEATDAGILWYGIDRTNRARTGEARVPHGQYKTIADSLGTFRKLRTEMAGYAKTTTEDLRARKLLEGNMDVYQWFVMISSHSQRHILQIREIKAHGSYPKG